ncbi:MAG: bifunctional phosphopantothenoylcysteine decarboxylase/phosphopantothenate--cysteine ligase CoaBC [Coriobacteriales bacterium]|jgi:phosphopantothenoylcysteine decarboxylase/phosphopantothenate--cysteine ligase|nr:bifunctional phosphopantothenoylcysteine decarboxylase/phosphopantothenate--cysteine ligase CoaBC [Coriobacteriales bacterium]
MKDTAPTVLLGVTGCIAAYKACEILRQLQKAGARVKVVMTPSGAEFVTPATFRALSQNEVALKPIDEHDAPLHHISLAKEADVFLIAPATANTINKLAAGIADNLLTTTALATEAPLIIAPAMNVHMWRDPSTQAALEVLKSRGVEIIEPTEGYLACGDEGEGKLADVEEITARTLVELNRSHSLVGRRFLITAGATREYLDPVRFISSPASGLTGYLIAGEAARRGAEVWLVSGPSELADPFDVSIERVTSAEEMYQACFRLFDDIQPDAAVFSAAVADFKPAQQADHKLKKSIDVPGGVLGDVQGNAPGGVLGGARDGTSSSVPSNMPGNQSADTTGNTDSPVAYTIDLINNPDILFSISQRKGDCFVVGFAAESENLLENARIKLRAKGADLIVANDISDPLIGFASDHNRWHFLTESGAEDTGIQSKRALVGLLLDRIASRFN